MIRCIRLYTADRQSRVEEGTIDLYPGTHGDDVGETLAVTGAHFQSSPPGAALDWHVAPARQLVVTLRGTLAFTTRDGERFTLRAGEVLLAEDTTGSGHEWSLEGDDPWERLYIVLDPHARMPFRRGGS